MACGDLPRLGANWIRRLSSKGNAMSELQQSSQNHLRAFVERIERLEEEKAALASDIRDVYAEAKAVGFDTKALRQVVRLRKQDLNERQEQEAILATYLHALGMAGDAEGGDAGYENAA